MYIRDSGQTISVAIAAILGIGFFFGLPIFLRIFKRPVDSQAPSVGGRPTKGIADDRQDESDDDLNILSESEADRRQFSALAAPAAAVAIFGATFCLLFALLNPLLQLKAFVSGEYAVQLSDGTLILRLSTITFAGTVVWKLVKFIWGNEHDREFADELQSVPEVLNDDLRRMRDVAQSTTFVAALFTLWLLYAKGVRTTPTAVLAYIFAFFSDDWWIISDYSRELKGRLLRWHRWRLHIANVLLLAPIAVIAWQEFQGWEVEVLYLCVAVILFSRYLLFSEAANQRMRHRRRGAAVTSSAAGPPKSAWPTRKWWAAMVVALAMIATLLTEAGGFTKAVWIAVIGAVGQAILTYLLPNQDTPGGMPRRSNADSDVAYVSWGGTFKWRVGTITALGVIVALLVQEGGFTTTVWIALIGALVQTMVTYLVPNQYTPGGVPLRY